ncbi:centrosomal protein of 89 kDa isoform X1 [Anguilla rostrata]|uniref:centrosomal protein of 89 kDa isoform X1 n=1 Tax=Anguilla rostrata TaxID=7938 RepID=UPI0030D47DE7
MMSKLSFRRNEKVPFKHIAHGLIPAATIAPRPAVPRTPPPRSPYPSPERPRSALAAAILSSSLTGRTVAIPPPRQRSYSESECSHSENWTALEPYASTAEFTRSRWSQSEVVRPRLPSPEQIAGLYDDEDDDEEEEEVERNVLSDPDEGHIYQSLERQGRSPVNSKIYAVPNKLGGGQCEFSDGTDESAYGVVPTQLAEEDSARRERAPSVKVERRLSSQRAVSSPDFANDLSMESPKASRCSPRKRRASKRSSVRDAQTVAEDEASREVVEMQKELMRGLREQNQRLAAEKQALAQKCEQQDLLLQRSQERLQQLEQHRPRLQASRAPSPSAGERAELHALRQQAQELVDENDGLKMTVHRLNVELSRYQAKFRPLSKEESTRISALPPKGPAPPWLLDTKYLSPLLLAYEDRISEKDSLLQDCEEDLKRFRERVEQVVQENEKLHEQLRKTRGVSQKEWRQLQDQAKLVLKENQVLMEQLEVQQAKSKDSHSRHLQEVSKVTKELMLLEAEKEGLQEELQEARGELQQARSSLEGAVSWEEHCAITNKLKRLLEQEEERRKSEVEDLMSRVSSLQTEKKSLLLEKTKLAADTKSMEEELEMSRHANRKAQRKVGLLKQQMEDSLDKELLAHQYLSGVVALAEKTTQERDQLIHMASTLEQDKQGVLAQIIQGTLRLGKLQEKVKVYKKQAAARLGVLGHRLLEQEDDFAGKAASYQREIRHLQRLLRDKQEALDGALQQKRAAEGELEIVWESTTRENLRIKEALLESLTKDSLAEALDRSSSPHAGLLALGLVPGPTLGCWSQQQQQQEEEPFPSPLTRTGGSAPPPLTSRRSAAVPGLHRSPMFESDSDQQQNPSSDESEKNGLDFYS